MATNDGRSRSERRGHAGAERAGERAGAPNVSDAKLAARTGRSVRDWFELLDAEAALRLSHDQIVALLVDVYEAPEWGAQTVAVRYQQEHGVALPGQQPDGTFQASASRSIRGSQLPLLDLLIERGSTLAGCEPLAVHRLPERTTAEWDLPNGDHLVARVGLPANDRCAVSLIESGIRLPELVAQLRARLERALVDATAGGAP